MEGASFSTGEEDLSAALTREHLKQEESNSSEEETDEHPDKGGQVLHVTSSENRGIASVLDPEAF